MKNNKKKSPDFLKKQVFQIAANLLKTPSVRFD